MELLVRPAQPSDIDEVYELLLEMMASEDDSASKVDSSLMELRVRRNDFSSSSKKELLREFEEQHARYLVGIMDAKIVGYARGTVLEQVDPFFKTTKVAVLNALCVSSQARGRGVASELYQELEKWFKKEGCTRVHLEVFEHNKAIDIYKRWGFTTFNLKMTKKL